MNKLSALFTSLGFAIASRVENGTFVEDSPAEI
jgi:hypothetical protein